MKKPERTYRIYSICLYVLPPVIFAELFTAKAHTASMHQITMAYHGRTVFSKRKLRCHRPVQVLLARCEAYNISKLKSRRKDLGRQLLICGSLLFSLDFTRQTKTKTKHIINQLQSQLQHFNFLYKYWIFDISTQITHAPYEGYRRVASKFDRKSGDCQLSRMLRTLVCVSAWWKTAVKNLGELVGEQI